MATFLQKCLVPAQTLLIYTYLNIRREVYKTFYSLLSASIGLILCARRAGK